MKKVTTKSNSAKLPKTTKSGKGLIVNVFDFKGQNAGTYSLPKEFFGQVPNGNLLALATRVYRTASFTHSAHTKTRGEVAGGGTKPWRQKGTGRARAGSRRSPLWVGGGIVFGPRKRDAKLTLTQRAKRQALIAALSAKTKSGQIKIIEGLEKIPPKTKVLNNLLKKITSDDATLMVVSLKTQDLKLASRNIPGVVVETSDQLNAYKILNVANILFSKEALERFK